MAVATKMRSQEKTGNWNAIFPTDQVTEQLSTLFVKKLLAVAVSNITYLRMIFPEYAFGDRCLEDLNLKILRDDSACPGACQVIKWVKGCFDALDKKYLRCLIIGIYEDPTDPETVIESYTFKFAYNNQGVTIYRNDKQLASAYSAAETKKATMQLLRTIVVLTQSLKGLPDDVMMTMKLLYYDDVTPSDYQPPGFKPADSEGFLYNCEPMNIKVGDVSTQWHTVKLRIKTDSSQFEVRDQEGVPAGTELADTDDRNSLQGGAVISTAGLDGEDTEEPMDLETQGKSSESAKSAKQRASSPKQRLTPKECKDVPNTAPHKTPESASRPSGSQQNQEEEDMGVRCPCGCNEDDGLMILCAVCDFWQHGVCFKVIREEDAPERHICDVCADTATPDKYPTDPYLASLSPVKVQATCLWRRALLACTEAPRLLIPSFARRLGVEMNVAHGLVNRLEKEGFVKNAARGKRLGKTVDTEIVTTEGFSKYFSHAEPVNKDSERAPAKVSEKEETPVRGKATGDNEVDAMVSQASNLQLSPAAATRDSAEVHGNKLANRKLQLSPEQGRKSSKRERKSRDTSHDSMDISSPKTRGRKRVFSQANKDDEFEISCSQETEHAQTQPTRSSKRRKASVTERAIMV
ncbi:HORMAD1 [Branchiostoma lanceolatum]|uniref:HORMAD1 protein n=1 Tax=Branchiostoma lanceolatum TaxID=7740 RepID=A0A8K0EH65_BRALA|nr:HORMAD1 [Branchiostoma lanceolatum]